MKTPLLAGFALLLLCGTSATGAAPAATVADSPSFATCEQRYAVTGLPEMNSDGSDSGPIALCRKGYAVAFNPDTRTPDWVIERLPLDWLSGKAIRKNNFRADDNPAVGPDGPKPGDYTGTKFDRGHQAPAGDFKSSQPMTDESFFMTNMAPQVGIGFNRNIWKQLETDIRGWVLCGGRPELYVVTGPVFSDDGEKWIPKGAKRVRVPDAFFKVIYDPQHKRALGMLLPNEKLDTKDLPNYAVPISEIEEETGIVFFSAMTKRQQNVLKNSAGTLWSADGSCTKATGE